MITAILWIVGIYLGIGFIVTVIALFTPGGHWFFIPWLFAYGVVAWPKLLYSMIHDWIKGNHGGGGWI